MLCVEVEIYTRNSESRQQMVVRDRFHPEVFLPLGKELVLLVEYGSGWPQSCSGRVSCIMGFAGCLQL